MRGTKGRAVREASVAGYTLMEVMVVTIILGVLGTIGTVQYLKSSENTKADDAIQTVNSIAAANRMRKIDTTSYVAGQFSNACLAGTCGGGSTACELNRCKYLAVDGWDGKNYDFYALTGDASVCGLGVAGSYYVACAKRRSSLSPYSGWGYLVRDTGVIEAKGGAPAPP